jgi:integrase
MSRKPEKATKFVKTEKNATGIGKTKGKQMTFTRGMCQRRTNTMNITVGELFSEYKAAILDVKYLDPYYCKDHLREYRNANAKRYLLQEIFTVYYPLFDEVVETLDADDIAAYTRQYQNEAAEIQIENEKYGRELPIEQQQTKDGVITRARIATKGRIKDQTMIKHLDALRGMFTWGKRLHYINNNPTLTMREPLKSDGREKVVDETDLLICSKAMDYSDIIKLLNYLPLLEEQRRMRRTSTNLHRLIGNRLEEYPKIEDGYTTYWIPLIILSLFTGARKGSAIALKWKDVTLNGENPQIIFSAYGSKAGNNIVQPLVEPILTVLRIWKRQNRINGKDPKSLDRYVFESSRKPGYPLRVDSSREKWKEIQEGAKLSQQYRWHDLRHTAATMWLRNGVDLLTISKMLGHRNPATTAKYLHADMGTQMDAAIKISNFYMKLTGATELLPERTIEEPVFSMDGSNNNSKKFSDYIKMLQTAENERMHKDILLLSDSKNVASASNDLTVQNIINRRMLKDVELMCEPIQQIDDENDYVDEEVDEFAIQKPKDGQMMIKKGVLYIYSSVLKRFSYIPAAASDIEKIPKDELYPSFEEFEGRIIVDSDGSCYRFNDMGVASPVVYNPPTGEYIDISINSNVA